MGFFGRLFRARPHDANDPVERLNDGRQEALGGQGKAP